MKISIKENRFKAIIAIAVLSIFIFILYMAVAPNDFQANTPAYDDQDSDNQENLKQEENAMLVDDSDVITIKEYYNLLSAGKLKEAYEMRATKDVSFSEFSTWYKKIEYAKPDNFNDFGDNTYDFIVNYKDKGEEAKSYGLRMTVSGGKLSTVFSKEFKAVKAEFGDYTAFSILRGDKMYLIIRKGADEDVIDTGDYSTEAISRGFHQSFSAIKFSPKGNYLLYSIQGYESIGTKTYDIKNKKKINEPIFIGAEAGDGVDFTLNEEYLYYCLGNGLYEGVPGIVYSIPDFKKVFDVSDRERRYMDAACEYKQNENAIIFTLTGPFDKGKPETKVIKYSL